MPPCFYYLAWLVVEKQYEKALDAIKEMTEENDKILATRFFQCCMSLQGSHCFCHEQGSELMRKALAKMQGIKEPRLIIKVKIEEIGREL